MSHSATSDLGLHCLHNTPIGVTGLKRVQQYSDNSLITSVHRSQNLDNNNEITYNNEKNSSY